VFAIQTNQDGTLSVAVWAILLSVFLVDATFTVAWRLRRGERVYEAHRRHAYQQAARDLGRHRPVTAAVVVLDAILAAVAAVAQAEPRAEIPLLIAASAAMAGLWWYWAIRIPSERAAGRAAPRQPPA
jgi:Fuc2NAc and GlcNAc transferase